MAHKPGSLDAIEHHVILFNESHEDELCVAIMVRRGRFASSPRYREFVMDALYAETMKHSLTLRSAGSGDKETG